MEWLRIKLIKSKLVQTKIRSILTIRVTPRVIVVQIFHHQGIKIIPQDYLTIQK